MSQSNSTERTEVAFIQRATQYYIAGRYAAIAQLFPVCANLLHHAVEMYLKGMLSRHQSLDELRGMKHNLKRAWRTFQRHFPEPHLKQFNASISALHKFERLRYPDETLEKGMIGQFSLLREHDTTLASFGKSPPPTFKFVLEDVDHLVTTIFEVGRVNPHFFLGSLNGTARSYLTQSNAHPFPPAA